MAEEELQIVRLKTEFYKDGFSRVLLALLLILSAIAALIALSVYLFITKPDPVYFATDNEFRVLAPVPLDKPYLSDADLLQWVSTAFPNAFSYNFISYQAELKAATQDFTSKGWQNLLGQLTNYHADFAYLQNAKMFVKSQLTGAPFILNKGLLPEGKYAWKVQIPMNVSYSNNMATRSLVIVAVIVRVSTLNNLNGVGIDDMAITEAQGNQVKTNA
jgi:intracellular multiplication protein IcmL